MPKVAYQPKRFGPEALNLIATADQILTSYSARGYTLTLRQLFYQFVSRNVIPNRDTEYKRLGGIINDARMAGLLDWSHMEDRTRNLKRLSAWSSPADIIYSAAAGYHRDWWANQDNYVELWIEKDALVGVIERPANRFSVPFFSCRGYTSQSEMWGAAQRLGQQLQRGKSVTILHLGDHDPSGIDMSRDIEERLRNFILQDEARRLFQMGQEDDEVRGALLDLSERFTVKRIALTMAQVDEINPPPNPAKLTDARAQGYIARYGEESWELDALSPEYLDDLITTEVEALIDFDRWDEAVAREKREKELLNATSRNWSDVADYVGSL